MPGEDRWCTYCGHRFSRDEHLERHILTHSGVKPFRCRLCHMSFARRDLLGRHQTVHGRDENGQETTDINEGIVPKASGRTAVACKSCAKSKTKCDMGFPCARCAQKDIVCVPRTTQRKNRHTRKIMTRRQSSPGPDSNGSGDASTEGSSPTPDPPAQQSNQSSPQQKQQRSSIQAQPQSSLPQSTQPPPPQPPPPQHFDIPSHSMPEDFLFSPSTSPLQPVQAQGFTFEDRPIDGPLQAAWSTLMDLSPQDTSTSISPPPSTAFPVQLPLSRHDSAASTGFDYFGSAASLTGFEDFSSQTPLSGYCDFSNSSHQTLDNMSMGLWNPSSDNLYSMESFDATASGPIDILNRGMYRDMSMAMPPTVSPDNVDMSQMVPETDTSFIDPSLGGAQLGLQHFNFSTSGPEGWSIIEWANEQKPPDQARIS